VGYAIGVPPAALAGRDRETVPEVASRYLWTTVRHVAGGFCPFRDGSAVATVDPAPDSNPRWTFYSRRGHDLRTRHLRNADGIDPDQQPIRGREPFRAGVTHEFRGDALTPVVDDRLDVVEVDR
jgi:hypothetical protein